jgi:hypothetical protein
MNQPALYTAVLHLALFPPLVSLCWFARASSHFAQMPTMLLSSWMVEQAPAKAIHVLTLLSSAVSKSRLLLQKLLIAATFFKDAFPKEWYYLWRMAAWVIAQPAVEIIDDFIALNDFHDTNVDGAEIGMFLLFVCLSLRESGDFQLTHSHDFPPHVLPQFAEANYENSRQLLDGSAAVFDAVRCRISPIDTEGPKWGHGCDSVDNNCDRFVDECDEDEVLVSETIDYYH